MIEKKNIFSELEKISDIYFDSEFHALSIGDEFRAIRALLPGLWSPRKKKYLFCTLCLRSGTSSLDTLLKGFLQSKSLRNPYWITCLKLFCYMSIIIYCIPNCFLTHFVSKNWNSATDFGSEFHSRDSGFLWFGF